MKQDTNDQKNHQVPWNKGKLIGQKSPLNLKEIWGIRIRLQMAKNARELALFNLAIDSKLRGCDLVTLLDHTKLESTVRYLGIEVDDALEISEQTEI